MKTFNPELRRLIDVLLEKNGSDLILTAGEPPIIRVVGELVKLPGAALSSDDVKKFAFELLTEEQQKTFEKTFEMDSSFGLENIARFRLNVFQQKGSVGMVVRMLPYQIPTMESLGVPARSREWLLTPHGIIIITGPTGSGKSTTQAAMLGFLNQNKNYHIVTIEDPIEYTHSHGTCIIEQREVGRDTQNFSQALKHVFRQTPDVIMIGEMRDRETIETALQLAETGHLVLTTLHTGDAMQAISRIIDVFPAEQQQQVRVQLSLTLIGVLVQQLIPVVDQSKRVLACEVLEMNEAIRNLIRKNDLQQIYSIIQTGSSDGMSTMNQSLLNLFQNGKISKEQALLFTTRQKELEDLIARQAKRPAFVASMR